MKKKFIKICILLLCLSSCEEKKNEPFLILDNEPEIVTNVKVENLPGGAKVTYTLPKEKNTLYVKAVYRLDNGEERVVISSAFKNYVMLEGFINTDKKNISLYTMDRFENSSKPVQVSIEPLAAPIQDVYGSLEVFETFGGVVTRFFNEIEAEYILHTLYKDSTGEWNDYDRLYTNSRDRTYALRGFESKPTEFAFYFTDKWKNSSDTLRSTLTPLHEIEIDKDLWKDADLADDFNFAEQSYWPIENLWREVPGSNSIFFTDPQIPGISLPSWITIDLGDSYKLGRLRVNQISHADSWIYNNCSPQIFEIWASKEATTDWDKWDLLLEGESVKPSGRPVGSLSSEDRALNALGEDFDFVISSESYRYVRFKTIQTWGRRMNMCLRELTLWGQKDG